MLYTYNAIVSYIATNIVDFMQVTIMYKVLASYIASLS